MKRGVEPHEELRTKIRELLDVHIPEARNQIENIWGKASKENQQHRREHAPVLEAAKQANRTLPKGRAKGPSEPERARVLDNLVKDAAGSDEKAQEEYRERIKDLPFVVESMDFPGDTFLDIQHLDGQVIIRLNTRHRFYREMWEPIRSIADRPPGSVSGDEATRAARRTIEALTLLIIAYGKAESMHENPHEQYGELRSYWGKFTDSLMGKVKDVI